MSAPATPNLALLASYPPPYGGVATHVYRLSALLEQRGVEHVIYNAVSDSESHGRVVAVARNRRSWLARYALTAREEVIYIFSARLEVWLLAAAMASQRGKRVIIRLRNDALPEYLKHPVTRALASFALRRARRVVAVSQALADAAQEAGVLPERILHQPGFLPPTLGASNDEAPSTEQQAFIASHSPIIAANGKVDLHKGIDLYGLDHMVELVARLRGSYPKLGLAVSFWDHLPGDEARLQLLRRRAEELGVNGNILFHTKSRPFVPVLARADLFIRPTCTDGDANSVREALYLGVPAVASDVVKRPKATVLHRTRDLEDLVEKVTSVLAAPRTRTPDPSVIDLAGVERYVQMLADLASPASKLPT